MTKNRRPSIKKLSLSWLVAIASCLLLIPTGAAIWQDVISFRSCNVNSSDLGISNCGKASLNTGDGLLLVLFIASALLVVALFTNAIRLTRRLS
jgi:TRAP-type C4-dicarboxylate transport system permease small subunit